MRIQELQIDRFGVWEDITLPFNERDVTVLYGPNEAGKSTLMRFIRGVLYGFPQRDERSGGPHRRMSPLAGSLRITHDGQEYTLKRTSRPGTRGDLEINGRRAATDDPLMQSILGRTPEPIFENIFAIGLHELQQLSTLNGEEVARHIYGLSLGPEGKQILQAQAAFKDEECFLAGTEGDGGEILSLMNQLQQADEALERLGRPTHRHTGLQSQLNELEDRIEGLQREQSRLEQNLRGHQFLRRIWEPWKKERSLCRQLDRIPADDLDRDVLNRFDELELEIEDLESRRKRLMTEARRAQQESEEIKIRPELDEHGCAIQQLFEQRERMREWEADEGKGNSKKGTGGAGYQRKESEETTREIQRLLTRMEGRWDVRRVEETNVSPEAMQQLMNQAFRYRRSARVRARTVQRYKKMTTRLPQLEQEWKSITREFGTQSPAEAREMLQKRLHDLEELRGLRVRQQHLRKAVALFGRDQGSKVIKKELPEFFSVVMWGFLIAGGCLFLAGMYAAFRGYEGIVAAGPTAWIAGGSLAMIGLAALGTIWTMKEYYSEEIHLGDSGMDHGKVERELARVDQSIDRLTRKDAFRPPLSETVSDREGLPVTEDELIERTRRQLADLDQVEGLGRRLEKTRDRLAKMRRALQNRQKQVGEARQHWSTALRHMGLSETLSVTDAIRQCQLIAEAQQLLLAASTTGDEDHYRRRELEAFHEKIQFLTTKLEAPGFRIRDPYQLVADWERERQLQGERRRERSQLRQTAREKRRESSRLVDKIEQKRQQRSKLLTRLGVTSRSEILDRLTALEQRTELREQLETVRREIQNITRTEPDLALVEEDLVNYEESRNRATIEGIQQELTRIEDRLRADYERVGTLKQELRSIEDDRSLTSLRFEREQIVAAMRMATERWAASRLAASVVEQVRQRIERERQPSTLKTASEYLARLTCGKYVNIWTPLEERILLTDDDRGESLRVEQLSSGTREQLFLAVRLAMIRDFAAQGVELPLILDDVTVNFDQVRTEAAVETLLEAATQGQQIMLFTCHLHLAHLFESEGVEPVWLPQQRAHVVA